MMWNNTCGFVTGWKYINVKLVSLPRAFVLQRLDSANQDLVLTLASKTECNWPPAHTLKECCLWKVPAKSTRQIKNLISIILPLSIWKETNGGLSIHPTSHAKCIAVRNRTRKAVLQSSRPSHTLFCVFSQYDQGLSFRPPISPGQETLLVPGYVTTSPQSS